MNFKKTLGLVLTAALVSSSLVAVKPAKAATTTVVPVVTTAPTSSLTAFNYFYAERSLLVAGEADTYVVDTNYSGQVQYELWVKKADDANAKWQVVSVDGKGEVGYTDAVNGQNAPYSIPLKSGFTFAQGKYYTAVYAKVAGTAGAKSYGHYIDSTGVETDSKSGTEQKYDIATTGYFNAVSTDYKQKYNEMLGDFLFDASSFVKGQKVTFKGFTSQKDGAKYKLVVRKFGDPASSQVVLNNAFASTVDWTPAAAGTYELIAWSEPVNAKGADRDGWRIGTVTVNDSTAQATVSTAVSSATFGSSITVTSDYTGATKFQVFTADGKTADSAVQTLGKGTTVYPAVKTGDAAVIALLDDSSKVLTTVNVTLGTDAKVTQPTAPSQPTTSNIVAKVAAATFGSSVSITTDNTSAAKFQVYTADGSTAESAVQDIAKGTTVYPAVKAGDTVTIKLFDSNSAVIASQQVTLQ